MSFKTTAISSIFAPKTQKGYFVFIPNIFHSILLASKVDYPKPQLLSTKITVFGNDLTIPLRAKTDNVFSVTIPEGAFSEIEFEIDTLLAKQANYGYTKGSNLATFDIFFCPYMGTPPATIGAGLDLMSGAHDVLDTISDIVGVLMSDGMPMVTEWRTLKGCSLIEYNSDSMSSSGITSVQNWVLKFHYTTMVPLIKMPIMEKRLTKIKNEKSDLGEEQVETGSNGALWDGPTIEVPSDLNQRTLASHSNTVDETFVS